MHEACKVQWQSNIISYDDVNALNEYLDLIDICSSSNETLPDLNVDTIEKCIKNLKLSKSAGADNIVAEHTVY